MKWGQVRKNADIAIQSFSDDNIRQRVSKVADYLDKEDGRRPFILSVLSRASKGQALTPRQLSYFESIEEIYLARERALQPPPPFSRDLWRDRPLVDKTKVYMATVGS
jgi:hypothetical protein